MQEQRSLARKSLRLRFVGGYVLAADWESELEPRRFYEPPERLARVNISFRIDSSLRDMLDAVARLWRTQFLIDGGEAEDALAIDITHVCRKFLRLGIDGAWDEAFAIAGVTEVPANETAWTELANALGKAAGLSDKDYADVIDELQRLLTLERERSEPDSKTTKKR